MDKPTIIHFVGNRPQFIKLAVLYDAIRRLTSFNQVVVHTGQHSSALMSDIFFNQLTIPDPDFHFETEASNADEFIGKTANRIESLLAERSDDCRVLVYGDTNSTLAAALAARRSGKQLLHFESGVRTADKSMPEEINRLLTDRLADVHYCCTQRNEANLIAEGYGKAIPAEVLWTGDLMLDAFMRIPMTENNVTSSEDYIACTIHRAGNITRRDHLTEIVAALNEIHKRMEVILPLHPHTRKRLEEFELQLNCTLIDPLGYPAMKRFLSDAAFVITDSGGACREAFFSGKKSLIIMEHPFWPEIVDAGAALYCGPDRSTILNHFSELDGLSFAEDKRIFGDGNAAEKIANHLKIFS